MRDLFGRLDLRTHLYRRLHTLGVDVTKPERTKFILENYGQARTVVPFADWKIYVEARKMRYDYTEHLLRYGRNFMKKQKRSKV